MQALMRNLRFLHPDSLKFAGIVGISVIFGLSCLILPLPVVLGASIVLILTLGILIYPFLGILGILLSDYVRVTHFMPGLAVIHPSLIVATWVFLSWALHVAVFKKAKIVVPPQIFVLGAFILIMLFSIFGAALKLVALNKLRNFLEYAIFSFLIIQIVNTPRKMKIFLLMFLVTNSIIALIAFPKLHYQYDVVFETGLGLGDFLGDGNDFALALNVAIPIAFFLLLGEKSLKIRVPAFGILLLLVANVILSGSRGGTVALTSTAIFSLIKIRQKVWSLILIGMFLVGVLTLAPGRYFSRIATIRDYGEDTSAQGRLYAWQGGIEMALDHPLVGVGVDNFSENYGTIYRPPAARGRSALSAHSVYFQILGELGFSGILCLMLFVFFNFRDNSRTRNELAQRGDDFSKAAHSTSLGLDVSLIAFLVGGAFLSAAYYPHLFVLTGMIVALKNIVQNSRTDESLKGI